MYLKIALAFLCLTFCSSIYGEDAVPVAKPVSGEVFRGLWRPISFENVKELAEKLNITDEKLLTDMKNGEFEIRIDGKRFTIRPHLNLTLYNLDFELDKEYDRVEVDGKKVKSKFTFENGVIKGIDIPLDSSPPKTVFQAYMKGENLVMEIEVLGIKATSTFARVAPPENNFRGMWRFESVTNFDEIMKKLDIKDPAVIEDIRHSKMEIKVDGVHWSLKPQLSNGLFNFEFDLDKEYERNDFDGKKVKSKFTFVNGVLTGTNIPEDGSGPKIVAAAYIKDEKLYIDADYLGYKAEATFTKEPTAEDKFKGLWRFESAENYEPLIKYLPHIDDVLAKDLKDAILEIQITGKRWVLKPHVNLTIWNLDFNLDEVYERNDPNGKPYKGKFTFEEGVLKGYVLPEGAEPKLVLKSYIDFDKLVLQIEAYEVKTQAKFARVPPMEDAFRGSYQVNADKNFYDALKTLNITDPKLIEDIKNGDMEITVQKEHWTIKTHAALAVFNFEFDLNKEYERIDFDGKKVRSVFRLVHGVLTGTNIPADGSPPKMVMAAYFKYDKLVVQTDYLGVKAELSFSKITPPAERFNGLWRTISFTQAEELAEKLGIKDPQLIADIANGEIGIFVKGDHFKIRPELNLTVFNFEFDLNKEYDRVEYDGQKVRTKFVLEKGVLKGIDIPVDGSPQKTMFTAYMKEDPLKQPVMKDNLIIELDVFGLKPVATMVQVPPPQDKFQGRWKLLDVKDGESILSKKLHITDKKLIEDIQHGVLDIYIEGDHWILKPHLGAKEFDFEFDLDKEYERVEVDDTKVRTKFTLVNGVITGTNRPLNSSTPKILLAGYVKDDKLYLQTDYFGVKTTATFAKTEAPEDKFRGSWKIEKFDNDKELFDKLNITNPKLINSLEHDSKLNIDIKGKQWKIQPTVGDGVFNFEFTLDKEYDLEIDGKKYTGKFVMEDGVLKTTPKLVLQASIKDDKLLIEGDYYGIKTRATYTRDTTVVPNGSPI